MKIHPIQTGQVRVRPMQPYGAPSIFHRISQMLFSSKWTEWLPIYAWLIEHKDGPILVDLGETAKINVPGYIPDNFLYHRVVQNKVNKEDELDKQLARLGFVPSDIQRVVLTHLHGDHVGGLYLFPHARIQVTAEEYNFASSKKGPGMGYFNFNWPEWFKPELIDFDDRKEGPFSKSFALTSDNDIIGIPTPGHSIGHMSIIIHSARIILGGDAVFNAEMLEKEIPAYVLPNTEGKQSVSKLKTLVNKLGYTLISSHDWQAPGLLKK